MEAICEVKEKVPANLDRQSRPAEKTKHLLLLLQGDASYPSPVPHTHERECSLQPSKSLGKWQLSV